MRVASLPEAQPLPDTVSQGMSERIQSAVSRLNGCVDDESVKSTHVLHEKQQDVFGDFVDWLREITTDLDAASSRLFARIILPPRTGKTIIAGEIIARTGLTATFLVPTKDLVGQTAQKLISQLPHTLVGVADGDRKMIVPQGVNIVTYQTMHSWYKSGETPPEIKKSALVFADEAHHVMTKYRMEFLKDTFDPLALRIALTATPDYNERRTLATYFPELIHEVSIAEAVQLELLAPLRCWVAEVDVDASEVLLVQGEYQGAVLGRLMAAAPFFRAAEVFRYDEKNRDTPALITCASTQQAYDLYKYLDAHGPKGRPKPEIILGETKGRDDLREAFEAGKIDTLIVVGCLIEGWDSPRCKLLIDLSPSPSLVRSTQKFCRVLTLNGDAEARIYVILPKNLLRPPILPMEILCPTLDAYEAGELIGTPDRQEQDRRHVVLRHPLTHPIDGVVLKSRIILTAQVEVPLLDKTSVAEVKAVLRSNPTFDERDPPTYWRFRALAFRHHLFTGYADHLMRYLGFRTIRGYHSFLQKYCTEAAANLFLSRTEREIVPCRQDVKHFLKAALQAPTHTTGEQEVFQTTLRALRGHDGVREDLEDMIWVDITLLRQAISNLAPIEQKILRWHFGLNNEDELTLEEIGNKFNLSRERIRQLELRAFENIRKAIAVSME